MQIVITMAGLGMRFLQAGYLYPKYMIDVCGKTLFMWSMSSLELFKKSKHYFIVRKADNTNDFIRASCAELGISNFQIIDLDHTTAGQAETVLMAQSFWDPNDELLIYNIDTFVEPPAINPDIFIGDGFIPCFRGDGDHWSFVQLDDFQKVINVLEKVRISENCTVGAYYFKTCQLYADLYYRYYSTEKTNIWHEQFVAPIYNQLIEEGGEVFISSIPKEKVHVLGTPEEVNAFKQSY